MRKSIRAGVLASAMFVAWNAWPAKAAVKPHSLISDGAVLQQGMDVPVWGTANEGENVSVKFQDQEVSTVAKDGKWSVKLKPLKAGGPFVMTITGENTVEVKDLLIGEVWLCSGQSNMAFHLMTAANAKEAIAASKDPQLRLCSVPFGFNSEPQTAVNVKWVQCDPKTSPVFSAVAYFFGRDLRKSLNVPVGLIHSSVGGTVAELWTSHQTFASDPKFKTIMDNIEAEHNKTQAAAAKYKEDEPKLLEKWKADSEQAKKDGKPAPRKPTPPLPPGSNGPSSLYNAMISPLQPYAMRGVIWYQGESNAQFAAFYQTLFPAMIKGWRDAWGQGEFPFLFVQIAPCNGMLPEIREAQLLSSQKVPNTAMAVITDVGDEKDIHPKQKEPVGARLALAARALAYGEKIEYSGPVYASMKITNDKAILSFTHIGAGLEARGGELKGFTIAGPDKKFVAATAKIDGDHIVVTGVGVSQPLAVRYGWATVPDVNLFNKDGLPASPFRTDGIAVDK